jgi:hypothetical protein
MENSNLEQFNAAVEKAVDREQALIMALGNSVVRVWSALPKEIQEKLFEHASSAEDRGGKDPKFREALATYLHDRHERTRTAPAR